MIEIIIAVIGSLSLIGAGFMTFKASKQKVSMDRVALLEARLDKLALRNQLLWRYQQELVHHIYQQLPPPPPPLPPELLDD